MKKRYKTKTRKDYSSREQTLSLSVLVFAAEKPDGIDQVLESVRKIKKPFEKDFEIIISAPGEFNILDNLNATEEYKGLIERGRIKILEQYSFIEAVNASTTANLLIIESDSLERTFNLEGFFSFKQEQLNEKGVYNISFTEDKNEKKLSGTNPLILCRKDICLYLTETFACASYRNDLEFMREKLQIPSGEYTIVQASPFSDQKSPGVSPVKKISEGLKRFYDWNFLIPLREYKTKPENTYSFISSSSLYRFIFYALSIVLLILMPVLSQQAGVSGDEEKHYNHAVKVYNYYATGGEDQSALSDPEHKLNYYGQSFDLLTYIFNRIFNVDSPYEARHAMNAIAGFLTLFFCGLLAAFLAGYRAGLITIVLMFFAPRFLGHSYNNPLDIPFALGYIFTIYQLIRFLNKLPVFSIRTAVWITLGIAFTISIRIGGLMLIPYAFAFAGLYLLVNKWDFKFLSKEYLSFAWKGLIYLGIISLAGYLLSLVIWPYGLQKPFANPFEALRMMSNITVSIRVLFDGEIHWSNRLPWYYITKNILYTVPVIILAGFLLSIFLPGLFRKRFKPVYLFFLYFSVIFPLAYVVYKNSNVYGGWRHLLFVFPPMAILAALSWDTLISTFKKKYLKYIVTGVMVIGLIHPVRFIVANHPFEYMYFNEIMGGTNAAYGKFETDYYLNSLKQGSEWLIENVLSEVPDEPAEKIRIASNASINYYFRNHLNKIAPLYTRYYDRGSKDWDYAIYFCNYISPDQLLRNTWPPYNTIHTIRVDSVPVCAVVKRQSKMDFEAIEMLGQRRFPEAIPLLEEVIEKEPLNEIALLKLSEAYIAVQNYDRAIEIATRCLRIYPKYDKALNLIGIAYLNKGDINNAITTFIEITRINYRFVSAYHNLGLAYSRRNDAEIAEKYFLKAIEVNRGFKPAYMALAELYKQLGYTEEANRYLQAGNSL